MSQEDRDRYRNAAHAMQTGVATEMNYGGSDMTAKHLRVGVNSALVDSSSLATLLMEKGLFSKDEYEKAIADGMEREVERYERHLRDKYGVTVHLA